MIVNYSKSADAVSIVLNQNKRARAVNVSDAMNVTLDEHGYPIAIELLAVSKYTATPEVDYVTLPEGGYISIEMIMEMKGVSRKTVERHLNDGTFVGAMKLGNERGQWWIPYDEAEAWQPNPRGRPKTVAE